MYVDVVRRVVEPEVAQRMELRCLERHRELGLHWVDVPGRGRVSACGMEVDLFSQWVRNDGGHLLHVCGLCASRMPSRQDRPLPSE